MAQYERAPTKERIMAGLHAAKKRGKPAHKVPAKPVTPPKSDEPTTDSVNSAFDSALGDPQRPVTPTPN